MKWITTEHKQKQLSTGEHLCVRTHTLTGDHDGPHVHIQASVHGAELQGNAVILALMEQLNQLEIHGSITFVPLCNHYGTSMKIGTYTYGRFNAVTGNNWNRNFIDVMGEHARSELAAFARDHVAAPWPVIKGAFKQFLYDSLTNLEESFARDGKLNDNNAFNLFLQRLASRADLVLDFHTGPIATRYLYAAEYEQEIASHLLFDHVLIIPNKFAGAMDEAAFMPWIHLSDELEKLGRTITPDVYAFTLEFGSEEIFSMNEAESDAKKVLNLLAARGVITYPLQTNTHASSALKDFLTVYAPHGGLCDYLVAPGARFLKDDVLAEIYTFDSLDPYHAVASTKKPVRAPADGIVINRCPSSAVHQGMELIQIMVNVQS